jgi:hypothetical protein
MRACGSTQTSRLGRTPPSCQTELQQQPWGWSRHPHPLLHRRACHTPRWRPGRLPLTPLVVDRPLLRQDSLTFEFVELEVEWRSSMHVGRSAKARAVQTLGRAFKTHISLRTSERLFVSRKVARRPRRRRRVVRPTVDAKPSRQSECAPAVERKRFGNLLATSGPARNCQTTLGGTTEAVRFLLEK